MRVPVLSNPVVASGFFAALLLAPITSATPITFDFRSPGELATALDEKEFGTVTVGELVATFSTHTGDKLNLTAAGLGINDLPTSADDPAGFEPNEFVQVVFPGHHVEVTQIVVRSWSATAGVDVAQLFNNGVGFATISVTGPHLLANERILSGNGLRIMAAGTGNPGNGWVLESLTVNTVPEPGSLALLAWGTGLLLRRRGLLAGTQCLFAGTQCPQTRG